MLHGSQRNAVEKEAGAKREEVTQVHKLSVCHIASGDRWAGAEVQVAGLIKALARRKDMNLSAILLNEGRLAEETRQCNVDVKVIPEAEKGFFQIFSEATRYLRGKAIRVVHSHRYKENLLAVLLAWRNHVPVVVRTQHGLPEPVDSAKRYKQKTVQLVDRIVARCATDRVISVSEELQTHLARSCGAAKVVTIHNAIDRAQVRSSLDPSEAKQRLGIPQECKVVGSAGRLEPVKRLDLFVAAAGQMATRLPNLRFLIVGEGSEEDRLRELVRRGGLQDRVMFLGHRNDIYEVLRAFDLLVLCSDHEGLPTVLLEALCLGIPVVARSVGGIPEVVQDGINGFLVHSSDPAALAELCLRILTDEVLRSRLPLSGAEAFSEKFTFEHAAAEVARLYRSLCGIR